MKRKIFNTAAAAALVLDLWAFLSWLEVIATNTMSGAYRSMYNLFEILF